MNNELSFPITIKKKSIQFDPAPFSLGEQIGQSNKHLEQSNKYLEQIQRGEYMAKHWNESSYDVQYPSIKFPSRCLICGNTEYTIVEEKLHASKVVELKKNNEQETIDLEMINQIPVCDICNKNIRNGLKRTGIGLAISIFIGILVLPKSFTGGFVGALCGGIIFGGLFGLFIMGGIDTYRIKRGKKPLFLNGTSYSYVLKLQDTNDLTIMDVIVRINNNEIFEEFRKLNFGSYRRAHDSAGAAMEQENAGAVKGVYSFIASTIMLDSSSQTGAAMLQQIPPYVYQSLNGTDSTFKNLYDKVQKEDSPHMLGTGMSHSPDDYADAFIAWLKTKGVNIVNIAPLMKKQIFLFAGDAMNPQTNKSFNWCMFIYFDIG